MPKLGGKVEMEIVVDEIRRRMVEMGAVRVRELAATARVDPTHEFKHGDNYTDQDVHLRTFLNSFRFNIPPGDTMSIVNGGLPLGSISIAKLFP